MSVTIYGIKNCDTMKKARTWLDGQGIAYDFHDHKAAGISQETLQRWCAALGWETVLNRAGTTFRALPDADKAGLDEGRAISLILAVLIWLTVRADLCWIVMEHSRQASSRRFTRVSFLLSMAERRF